MFASTDENSPSRVVTALDKAKERLDGVPGEGNPPLPPCDGIGTCSLFCPPEVGCPVDVEGESLLKADWIEASMLPSVEHACSGTKGVQRCHVTVCVCYVTVCASVTSPHTLVSCHCVSAMSLMCQRRVTTHTHTHVSCHCVSVMSLMCQCRVTTHAGVMSLNSTQTVSLSPLLMEPSRFSTSFQSLTMSSI